MPSFSRKARGARRELGQPRGHAGLGSASPSCGLSSGFPPWPPGARRFGTARTFTHRLCRWRRPGPPGPPAAPHWAPLAWKARGAGPPGSIPRHPRPSGVGATPSHFLKRLLSRPGERGTPTPPRAPPPGLARLHARPCPQPPADTRWPVRRARALPMPSWAGGPGPRPGSRGPQLLAPGAPRAGRDRAPDPAPGTRHPAPGAAPPSRGGGLRASPARTGRPGRTARSAPPAARRPPPARSPREGRAGADPGAAATPHLGALVRRPPGAPLAPPGAKAGREDARRPGLRGAPRAASRRLLPPAPARPPPAVEQEICPAGGSRRLLSCGSGSARLGLAAGAGAGAARSGGDAWCPAQGAHPGARPPGPRPRPARMA